MSRIGDAIRQEREACFRLTQQQLADDIGLSRCHIANIEAGRILMPIDTLLKISNNFADVDSIEWCWMLLADLWGQPIVDAMKAHAVAENRLASQEPQS